MFKKNYLLFILMMWGISAHSQVVINEYSASNLESFYDSYQKTEDWIELYNSSNASVDISGWFLSDKVSKPEKYEIPAGTIIPGNGFLVFLCSGRDLNANGEYHTNFKLTQTKEGEVVQLTNASGNVLESHLLELTLVEHSRCRVTDGSSNWVIATNPTFGNSNNGANQYTRYTEVPSASLAAGFYNGPQTVTLTNNEANSILRYTTDGTNPTATSPEYVGPIAITSTTVVKAQSYSIDPSIHTGKMDFNTYFIDEDFSLAVFSVAADDVIDLANGEGSLIPIGSLEYFNKDKEREATSYGSLNRHGQDSWALDHRSIDWVSRDEMGYSKAVNAPLFSYSDREAYQKFMFRNSGDDNYPAINDGAHEGSTHIRDEYVQELAREGGMKLDTRAVERVILFLNGQYWGVYGMRERPVDHDYTSEYYDQGKYDIQYLSTWAFTEIQYGGQQAIDDWVELRDFILKNDMSDSTNYQIADEKINLTSLIDYMIVNLTCVASDWLNYNTGWWRGLNPEGKHKKWGYILWDLDATFDYYINYSGVPNTDPDAAACDIEDIAAYMDFFFGVGVDVGQHEKIFLRLLEQNETFKQLYYSRYADMMNTVYTCENMMSKLDEMLAVIEPEMPRQIQRWGGTMEEWKSNVQDLKEFIAARCTLVNQGMDDCYDDISGLYEVTLLTIPGGIGEIDFNTLDVEEFPWTGEYYGGMQQKIKAKVFKDFEDVYEFKHWISSTGNVIFPDVNSRKATMALASSDTLTAVFDLISSSKDIASNIAFHVFPNPATDVLTVDFELEKAMDLQISLVSALGTKVPDLYQLSGNYAAGRHSKTISIHSEQISSGLYLLVVDSGIEKQTYKVNIIK